MAFLSDLKPLPIIHFGRRRSGG